LGGSIAACLAAEREIQWFSKPYLCVALFLRYMQNSGQKYADFNLPHLYMAPPLGWFWVVRMWKMGWFTGLGVVRMWKMGWFGVVRVTHGHWKWQHSIAHRWVLIGLCFCLTPFLRYMQNSGQKYADFNLPHLYMAPHWNSTEVFGIRNPRLLSTTLQWTASELWWLSGG